MAPSVSGLLYPDMKLARAAEHLNDLRALLRVFRENAYTITRKDDEKRQLHIIRVDLKRASPRIPLTIGELAYSLRSALNHLAWQLALLSGRPPATSNQFPIHSDDHQRSRERFMLSTWDIPCEAVEVIKTFQPYVRGKIFKTHPLWQLKRLCNLDKHVTMGFNHAHIAIKTGWKSGLVAGDSRVLRRDFEQSAEVAVSLALKNNVTMEPQPPEFVFGKPLDAPGPAFELSEAELAEIDRFIRDDVLPSFARFFPNGERLTSFPPA